MAPRSATPSDERENEPPGTATRRTSPRGGDASAARRATIGAATPFGGGGATAATATATAERSTRRATFAAPGTASVAPASTARRFALDITRTASARATAPPPSTSARRRQSAGGRAGAGAGAGSTPTRNLLKDLEEDDDDSVEVIDVEPDSEEEEEEGGEEDEEESCQPTQAAPPPAQDVSDDDEEEDAVAPTQAAPRASNREDDEEEEEEEDEDEDDDTLELEDDMDDAAPFYQPTQQLAPPAATSPPVAERTTSTPPGGSNRRRSPRGGGGGGGAVSPDVGAAVARSALEDDDVVAETQEEREEEEAADDDAAADDAAAAAADDEMMMIQPTQAAPPRFSASPGSVGLTDFERERRRNIKRNETIMASLNIATATAKAPAKPSAAAEPAPATPAAPESARPAAPVVDACAGDAAARFIRARLLSGYHDNAPSRADLCFCPELSSHQKHLVDILTNTIEGGQNNSVLLMGARGSGKTTALDSALKELKATHGEKVLPVRLSGMLHSDEKVGMREIACQLCDAGEELEFNRAAGFAENVAFMREVLRALEGGGRAVIFILEEFDLFTLRGASSKQTLLYSIMDLLQQPHVSAAVVGVTCRHDAVELLEKRVRSRFAHRRVLLAPPAGRMKAAALVRHALRLPECDKQGAEEEDDEKKREISSVFVYPPEPGYARRFNAALDDALSKPAAANALTQFEYLECTPRAAADLALVTLSRMNRALGTITADDIARATQTQMADTYVRSLSSSSVLELCAVVAMSRLHRIRRMLSFNFKHVESELRTMASNDFLGEAGRAKQPVLVRAFEGLLSMGLVEAKHHNGGVRKAGGEPPFRQIQLLITDEEVETGVKRHPQAPAGLIDMLTHEGVRMTTGC